MGVPGMNQDPLYKSYEVSMQSLGSWLLLTSLWGLFLTAGCGSVTSSADAASPSPSPTQLQVQMLPIEAEVKVADQIFKLEVARTVEQQRLGLMRRDLDSLPPDQGMLFPYNPPQPVAFWMYNTWINLDIIFLFKGMVVYIAADVPGCPNLPCPAYGPGPDQLVDQVVELRGGTAAKLGLKVGNTLTVQNLK